MSGGAAAVGLRRVAILLPRKEGFAPGGAGAISLIVRDLARASPPGWETVVLGTPPARGVPGFPGIAFRPVRPSGVTEMLFGRNSAYAAAAALAMPRIGADVVEVHNRPDAALRVRGLPGLRARVALVLHNDPQGMRRAHTPGQREALLNRLDAVVCVSGHLRDRLLEGVRDPRAAARAHVLHNALPLTDLPPPVAVAARERLLLFVGRVTADKGADTFIRAAAAALPDMPGWRALMVGADRFQAGAPDSAFIQALRAEAGAAGVELSGFLPNDQALALLARAAVVAVPSRWHDPFPRVAQEALAGGAALVTTRRGGLPELAGDAALYVDHEDPADLAAAFRRLATEPGLREALARRAAARAAAFGLEAAVARWTALRERMTEAS